MLIYTVFNNSIAFYILHFLVPLTCHKFERVLIKSAIILALKCGMLNSCGNPTFTDIVTNVNLHKKNC